LDTILQGSSGVISLGSQGTQQAFVYLKNEVNGAQSYNYEFSSGEIMFMLNCKLRVSMRHVSSVLFAIVFVTGFVQSAQAADYCHRHIYNKSNSEINFQLCNKGGDCRDYPVPAQTDISYAIPDDIDNMTLFFPDQLIGTYLDGRNHPLRAFKFYYGRDSILGSNICIARLLVEVSVPDALKGGRKYSSDREPYVWLELNDPADGDIIIYPNLDEIIKDNLESISQKITKPEANCVSFFTEINGGGKRLNLCKGDRNWKDNANLGGSGSLIHSHHRDVRSFLCGANAGRVQFMDGNKTPMPRHNEYCKDGNIVNPDPWVAGYATGVWIFDK